MMIQEVKREIVIVLFVIAGDVITAFSLGLLLGAGEWSKFSVGIGILAILTAILLILTPIYITGLIKTLLTGEERNQL